MQRIGLVLHTSSSRNIILKADKNLPRLGDQVIDENLKPVGIVFDVFGPVSSPYVAVRPSVEDPDRFIKHILYVVPSSGKPRREKKRR